MRAGQPDSTTSSDFPQDQRTDVPWQLGASPQISTWGCQEGVPSRFSRKCVWEGQGHMDEAGGEGGWENRQIAWTLWMPGAAPPPHTAVDARAISPPSGASRGLGFLSSMASAPWGTGDTLSSQTEQELITWRDSSSRLVALAPLGAPRPPAPSSSEHTLWRERGRDQGLRSPPHCASCSSWEITSLPRTSPFWPLLGLWQSLQNCSQYRQSWRAATCSGSGGMCSLLHGGQGVR